MKRYRRLEVGEALQVGDFYNAKSNPQPPYEAGMMEITHNEHWMFGSVYREDISCYYYRPVKQFKRVKLIRKYRLVRAGRPIQMFDWFKLTVHHDEDDAWPAPHKQYDDGWTQIEPGIHEHLTDGNPLNRQGLIFARFVDCIPAPKS